MNASAVAVLSLGLLLVGHVAPAAAQPRGQARPGVQPPASAAPTQEAERAYHSGDFDRAERLAGEILRREPQNHVALYLRASARAEIGPARGDTRLIREGIADAREAIRLGGSRNMVYYLPYLYGMTRLAAVEGRAEHAETAVQVANQILEQPQIEDDDRANLLYQRGLAKGLLEDHDGAAADYQQAIRLNRSHLGAWIGLAEAHAAAGNTAAALEAFDGAVRAFPDNPLVYNNRGMFRQQQGETAEAVADFTRAIELDRQFYFAYTNRGFALMESGESQAAEADLTESLRINPSQPVVYGLRGTARIALGRLQPAIADYARVVQMEPGNPLAHADLGFAQFFGEDYGGAARSFDRAVELDQNLRHLHPWRYLSLELAGREPEARSRFQQGLRKAPAERDWAEQLVAYLAGEASEAELLEAIDDGDQQVRDVQLCEAHYFLGRRKLQQGDAAGAAEHFRRSVDTGLSHLASHRAAKFTLGRLTGR